MSLDKKSVKEHIDQLTTETNPLWGLMTAQHLIEHFIYVFRMAIGEIKHPIVTPSDKLEVYKKSLHNERKIPRFFSSPYLRKGEVEDLEYESLEEAKAKFYSYWDKYQKYYQNNPKVTNDHAIYGPLDKTHWDLLMDKHFNYHFGQFNLKQKLKNGYVEKHIEKSGIGVIEFFHPAHNALPSYLLHQIVDAINIYSKLKACKVILLQSGGNRTFCAGADFNELKAISTSAMGKTFFLGFANVINAIRKSEKLVVGRVQGKAVGGGVGIAAAVDYCFATQYASIKLSELGIGIGPFVIGPAVERKIGTSAFSQLTLDFNNFYDHNWCKAKGLYNETFENAEQMDDRIADFCTYLSQTNPEAQLEVKKMLWEGTQNWDKIMSDRAAISGRLVLSEQTKKALGG